jgi:hypothetical protein
LYNNARAFQEEKKNSRRACALYQYRSGDGLDVHCMVDGSMCVVVDRVVKKVTQLAGAQLKM